MEEIMKLIGQYIDNGRGFEVIFEKEIPIINELKGVSKIKLNGEEIKGIRRITKKKILEDHKAIIIESSKILIENKIPFKVTIFPKEVILRFDLDHYIHLYPNKCMIIGFNDINEPPLYLIKDQLKKIKEFKILKQVK
ncbi:MAG: hypothetical protein NZ922_02970 [Candidatus Methanomethyliaceae archaeon]|nr:hypothetical protein [Candidatus Methanomethyliaceae archaeon]MDW7970825.1 hypothetical protein [Nitrososphaerota archaeon]